MIPVDISTAIFLYVMSALFVIFALWIFPEEENFILGRCLVLVG